MAQLTTGMTRSSKRGAVGRLTVNPVEMLQRLAQPVWLRDRVGVRAREVEQLERRAPKA